MNNYSNIESQFISKLDQITSSHLVSKYILKSTLPNARSEIQRPNK